MALGSIPWAVGVLFGKAFDRPKTFVGKCCVGVLGRRSSPVHWMQGRNPKEGNRFLNRNIRRCECTATLL
jgi:hypothetical protein